MYVNSVIFLCKSSSIFSRCCTKCIIFGKLKYVSHFLWFLLYVFFFPLPHTLTPSPLLYISHKCEFFIYFCTKYLCYTQTIFKCSSGISKTQQALENSNNSDMNKFSAKKLSKEVNLRPEREKDNQRQY